MSRLGLLTSHCSPVTFHTRLDLILSGGGPVLLIPLVACQLDCQAFVASSGQEIAGVALDSAASCWDGLDGFAVRVANLDPLKGLFGILVLLLADGVFLELVGDQRQAVGVAGSECLSHDV